MTKGRRAARRSALFALYKWDLTGKVELDEDADEYTLRTVEEVQSRTNELDRRITDSAESWTAPDDVPVIAVRPSGRTSTASMAPPGERA